MYKKRDTKIERICDIRIDIKNVKMSQIERVHMCEIENLQTREIEKVKLCQIETYKTWHMLQNLLINL